MALFRRILSGLLAAVLLVQPAVASGSCCCTAKLTESAEADISLDSSDSPVIAAGCPRCRAVAKQSNNRKSSDSLQSDDCGCSRNSRAIPATVTEQRDVKLEVSSRSLWLPSAVTHLPDVRCILTSQVASPTGTIPLTVLHCRWLA
jgi:hypothetical protein